MLLPSLCGRTILALALRLDKRAACGVLIMRRWVEALALGRAQLKRDSRDAALFLSRRKRHGGNDELLSGIISNARIMNHRLGPPGKYPVCETGKGIVKTSSAYHVQRKEGVLQCFLD